MRKCEKCGFWFTPRTTAAQKVHHYNVCTAPQDEKQRKLDFIKRSLGSRRAHITSKTVGHRS